MSIRGLGDGYAFQRLLWLLVGTVIVPTILLAIYGVWAIRNHRAAVVEQIRAGQQADLHLATATLFDEIAELDSEVRLQAHQCGDAPVCDLEIDGIRHTWTWQGDAPANLGVLGVPSTPSSDTTWFATPHGEPIAVLDIDGLAVAWQLSLDHLQARVDALATDRFEGTRGYALRFSESQPGPAAVVTEMMRGFGDPLDAQLRLERPLAQWHLILTYGPEDSARESLETTSLLAPAGLVALVALVVVGTIVSLSSAWREIRLSRLQTDFVSSVSHELRTPLTSIRMFVETLQSGRIEDPAKVEECLDLLARETDRLSRMIERVLDWARMEAGRRTYEFEEVTVAEIFDDAIDALRSQTLMAGAIDDIECTVDDDLPVLRVDRDAIVEALLNLLHNAVKYSPAPRRITLSATRSRSKIGLAVQDNGLGVAATDRKRIFEKFYQADMLLSSQSGASRGSGLGLSIVRAVVRGHNGRVELETELGKGSRFTLWLPI